MRCGIGATRERWTTTADIFAVLIALVVAVVDVAGRDIYRRCGSWHVASSDRRTGRSCQSLKRPICASADCALRAGACRHAVVGRARGARGFMPSSPTVKLLVLPVLFYHFERSTRGMWVFIAFLMSCALLMVMSWIVAVLSRPFAQGGQRRGARHFRQELHRPKPGIRACARWRWLIPIVVLSACEERSWQALLLGAICCSASSSI